MIIYQVHHYIQPDKTADYLAATLANARASLNEPGIVRFDVYQDTEDATHFSLFETYKYQAARDAHLETAHFKAWAEVYYATRARVGEGHSFTQHLPG